MSLEDFAQPNVSEEAGGVFVKVEEGFSSRENDPRFLSIRPSAARSCLRKGSRRSRETSPACFTSLACRSAPLGSSGLREFGLGCLTPQRRIRCHRDRSARPTGHRLRWLVARSRRQAGELVRQHRRGRRRRNQRGSGRGRVRRRRCTETSDADLGPRGRAVLGMPLKVAAIRSLSA